MTTSDAIGEQSVRARRPGQDGRPGRVGGDRVRHHVVHAGHVPDRAAERRRDPVFAVATFYLAIASLRTDLVLTVIIWLIFVGLVLLSIGFGASSGNVVKAGGWVVLVFAVLAWYHAAGDVIASTFGRKSLPFGPPPVK
jgi:GPR1/FUN34/yaaH family